MSYMITDSCTGCELCKRFCPADAITGTKKELHQVDDSLCIACGACGRICPHRAVTDALGRTCAPIKRSLWKKPRFDPDRCVACLICPDTCPAGCISMSDRPISPNKKDGLPYLKDPKACIGCGFCEDDCPTNAVFMVAG